MIVSKPDKGTLFSVSLFLCCIIGVASWLTYELVLHPASYFVAKLILVPILIVIAIVIGTKLYFSSVEVHFGQNQVSFRPPLRNPIKKKLSDVQSWQEERIKTKGRTFKQLRILFNEGQPIKLSNRENTNYDQVIKYLIKKIPGKRKA